jgi:hypothetical protein
LAAVFVVEPAVPTVASPQPASMLAASKQPTVAIALRVKVMRLG